MGPGSSGTEEWWSPEKVESFYYECCVGREEQPHPGISAALKVRLSFHELKKPTIVATAFAFIDLLTVSSAPRAIRDDPWTCPAFS